MEWANTLKGSEVLEKVIAVSLINRYISGHRGIGISRYRTPDMAFHEDEQRKRTRHAAENFAVIRKIASNFLKKDTGKESLR